MKKINLCFFIVFLAAFLSSCNDKPQTIAEPVLQHSTVFDVEVQKLYIEHCTICHGDNGKKGFAGAADFSVSEMCVRERIQVIKNGKNKMLPFKDILTPKEIEQLAEYTLTLK